ncbi:hypothetical protein SAMN05444008_11536 [Cnuella takakiae]|uniref:Uncharacterized protein n=1 Tax=Cnuella takakiae TaxID=1302690 RepID=A0A1M5FZJ9_9BACT|nr:hypothetical protein SAMN05444008_11536 [Cnuella takakiae]
MLLQGLLHKCLNMDVTVKNLLHPPVTLLQNENQRVADLVTDVTAIINLDKKSEIFKSSPNANRLQELSPKVVTH